MNSKQIKKWLAHGLLLSGLSLPWQVHADAAASAVLSDLQFFAVDLYPLDGIDPTYTLDGAFAGHAYLAGQATVSTRARRSPSRAVRR